MVFHTDAVQAFGAIPIQVDEMNIDMLSITGHKLYGPKGTGALYIRKGIILKNLIDGGAQELAAEKEQEQRTLQALVGLGKAAQLAQAQMKENAQRLTALRDRLIQGLLQQDPGNPAKRPSNKTIA